MSRWKAALIHLGISLCLACAVGALLYFLWFPQPWFIAAGASSLILLLMGVDVGIGPLLTAIVFRPGKSRRALRLDLAVIGVCQAVAFAYGLHVIMAARPVFVVAAVDRYVLVAADQLADADLAKGDRAAFRHRSWRGPLLVGALPSGGADTADRVMNVLAGGKDIDRLPAFYVPYSKVAGDLMERALPLSRLRLDGAQRERLQALRQRYAASGHELRYLPVQRQDESYTAIVDLHTRQPVAVLDVDAWEATAPREAGSTPEAGAGTGSG